MVDAETAIVIAGIRWIDLDVQRKCILAVEVAVHKSGLLQQAQRIEQETETMTPLHARIFVGDTLREAVNAGCNVRNVLCDHGLDYWQHFSCTSFRNTGGVHRPHFDSKYSRLRAKSASYSACGSRP